MNPTVLLERLEALGVTVRLTGDSDHPIRLSPQYRIPAELRPDVVARKRDLAALLERQARTWQDDASDLIWPSVTGEDPRPDLPGTELWAHLLEAAGGDADDPQSVYGRLLGARACGAVLERRNGRWKLAPTVDPTERRSTWQDRESWDRDAERWLKPRSREIVTLLRQLDAPDGAAEG